MGDLSVRHLGWAVLLCLTACDAGPSAVTLKDGDGQSATSQVAVAEATTSQTGTSPFDTPYQPPSDVSPSSVAPVDHSVAPDYGKPLRIGLHVSISEDTYGDWPLWSKNRKYSADDNAHYQFGKHGVEFGAKSYGDYVGMAHSFVHSPPSGTETLKRVNGDTLLYDGRDNVFAVMTKQGAPRTLFRPDTGREYWEQQKILEAAKRDRSSEGEN